MYFSSNTTSPEPTSDPAFEYAINHPAYRISYFLTTIVEYVFPACTVVDHHCMSVPP